MFQVMTKLCAVVALSSKKNCGEISIREKKSFFPSVAKKKRNKKKFANLSKRNSDTKARITRTKYDWIQNARTGGTSYNVDGEPLVVVVQDERGQHGNHGGGGWADLVEESGGGTGERVFGAAKAEYSAQWADGVTRTVSDSETATAPRAPVTLAAFTRRALSSPAVLLHEARALGVFHVKWLLGGPLVAVASPKVATVVLSKHFQADRFALNFDAKSILVHNGPEHKRDKQILLKLFNPLPASSSASAKRPSPTLDNLIDHIHSRLNSEVFPELNTASSSSNLPIDLAPIFEELFVDVFALWCLGLDPNISTFNDDEAIKRREKIVDAKRCLANLTFIVPTGITWYFDRLRTFVPFTEYLMLPGHRDYLIRRNGKARARTIIDAEYIEIVKEYKESNGKRRGGLIGALIEETLTRQALEKSKEAAKEEQGGEDEQTNPKAAVDDDAADTVPEIQVKDWENIFGLLEDVQIAGQMPLYSLIPHTLYLLSHNPAAQKQILTDLSKLSSTRPISRSSQPQILPSLDAFILETLRTCPPLATTYSRMSATNRFKLPDGWNLPSKTHVAVDLLSTLRDVDSFGADADQFSPARFNGFLPYQPTYEVPAAEVNAAVKAALKIGDSTAVPLKTAFVPFGNGVYACPAQRLALDVVKIVVGEVLRRFEVLPASASSRAGENGCTAIIAGMEEFGYEHGGVLRHLEGCPVVVKKRK
ncbi:hypothetical protein HK100_007268 [Physocladia obscura]|uniref:Cytochrome P450 n=1 Tax=Physocladia obscura TaxID=109957 RepID=A0AAD5SPG5_9FUNG|nr:hypothetical protein HK100_007268 [Physocladia obscura]